MAESLKDVKSRIDLAEIKRLIHIIEKSPITEFELVDKDLRIRISKNGSDTQAVLTGPQTVPVAVPAPAAVSASAPLPEAQPSAAEKPKTGVVEVTAPMVGTFYRAPSPDAEPYVRIGDTVEKGSILCIVEAMKIMNEIEAEVSGKIAEILIENAQPLEYGQVMFRIETKN